MKSYIISRKPERLDWEKIPAVNVDTCLWVQDAGICTQAQLCYDAESVYVRMCTREAHIVAEEKGVIGEPWQDSCMEFFFCPDPHSGTYLNIEFNPNRCLFLGVGLGRNDRIRLLLPEKNPLNAEAVMTEDGWQITYQIPTELIRRFVPAFQAESGAMMRGNFYKCGERTPQAHYYAWNPIELTAPEFHCSEYFGKLYFE